MQNLWDRLARDEFPLVGESSPLESDAGTGGAGASASTAPDFSGELQVPASWTQETRRRAVNSALAQLKGQEQALLLRVLLTLGRSRVGTEPLSRSTALELLLDASGLADGTINEDAVRCLCNTLTLHPAARDTFPLLLVDRPACISALVALADSFLLNRLLFLSTVVDTRFVDALYNRTDLFERVAALVPRNDASVHESTKWIYNIMLHAGRKTLEIPEPRRARRWLNATQPPSEASSISSASSGRLKYLSNKIKNVSSTLKSGSQSPTEASLEESPQHLTNDTVGPFIPLFRPLVTLACQTPYTPSQDDTPLRQIFNALMLFPIEIESLENPDCSWLLDTTAVKTSSHIPEPLLALPSLPLKVYDTLATYIDSVFPGTVTPATVFNRGKVLSSAVDDIMSPMLLFLHRLLSFNAILLPLKAHIFPPDPDRSIGPEKADSLAGQLVRIMIAHQLPASSFSVGEVLFDLSGREPTEMCLNVGYGNAVGFLRDRDLLIPPPDFYKEPESNKVVNPITGIYDDGLQGPETMTQEEKEREAERLFTLFDRMERNPALRVENPARKIQTDSRFEKLSLEDDKKEKERLDKEDEQLERDVEIELAQYKAKKAA